MRTLIAAAFAIALLPVTAHAQSNPSHTTSLGERTGQHSYKVWKPKYQKEMEERMINKPYEDALKSIPDSKIEPDPWRDAR